jgi:glycosyl transferase family 25
MTAVGYYLSPHGARKLLEKSRPWHLAVDLYMGEFWRHGVQCFGIIPTVIEPNPALNSTRFSHSRKPESIRLALTKKIWAGVRGIKRTACNLKWRNIPS